MPAPSFNQTRPFGEDVVFRSSTTGEHNIDVYLEAAERGGKTLGELVALAFDESGDPLFASGDVQAAADSAAASAADALASQGAAATSASQALGHKNDAEAAAAAAGAAVSSKVSKSGDTITGDLAVQGLFDFRDSIVISGSNVTAQRSRTYVLTASQTLTLPASPSQGHWVRVVDRSGAQTSVIARNGQSIMGLAEDMTLDIYNLPVTLVFADASRGWVVY
jgi:hypothetical protein